MLSKEIFTVITLKFMQKFHCYCLVLFKWDQFVAL